MLYDYIAFWGGKKEGSQIRQIFRFCIDFAVDCYLIRHIFRVCRDFTVNFYLGMSLACYRLAM